MDEAGLDRQLDHLHAAGVRGVRLNLFSPAGHQRDWAAAQALAGARAVSLSATAGPA